MGYTVVDTNRNTMKNIQRLHAYGIKGVIRYFFRGMSDKVIRKAELDLLLREGFQVGIVYEGAGDKLSAFSEDIGYRDAAWSRSYGKQMGVPEGAAIYFAVDFDASATQVNHNILPYFKGVNRAMEEANTGFPKYRVGVYGSGMVCETIKRVGLAELTWVSCSTGWTGTRAYTASNKWNLLQKLPTSIAGLDTDPDIVNPDYPNWGYFDKTGLGTPVAVEAKEPDIAPVAINTARPPDGPLKWVWALLESLFARK